MGHPPPSTSPDILASDSKINDSKIKNEYSSSFQSIDAAPPDVAQGFDSPFELGFDVYDSEQQQQPEEQPWQPNVRDWVIIVAVAIVAMMDAFDSTVLLAALPVSLI